MALDAALDVVAKLEAEIRAAQAEQLRQVSLVHRLMHAIESQPSRNPRDDEEFVRRSTVAELATTLRIHERTASRLVADADALADGFAETHAALAVGDIAVQHLRELLDVAGSLPRESRSEFEAAALEKAGRMTPSAFRLAARRLRERMHPRALEERHAHARDERRIALESDADGMAWLHLYLEAERAFAIVARVEQLAAHTGTGDTRTRPQREVDSAVALLLGLSAEDTNDSAAISASGVLAGLGVVRPTIYVTVPVMTLLGLTDEPGDLDGYGPIDPETARRIVAHAPSFRRILTHPESGAYLSYGRDTYRVPSDLTGYLRLRDGQCRFPGCGRRAVKSDIDHTSDWQFDGHTSHRNLAHLCRKHHRLKHQTVWRMVQLRDGGIRWTSPSGREHVTRPEHFTTPPPDRASHPKSSENAQSTSPSDSAAA